MIWFVLVYLLQLVLVELDLVEEIVVADEFVTSLKSFVVVDSDGGSVMVFSLGEKLFQQRSMLIFYDILYHMERV
jgi:hypothetical protein